MRRSELLFILFQVTLKFWRFIFWKTQKCYMMSFCMTKLKFPLEPYMLFMLEKLSHICCLLLHWVLSSFVDPYKRFVILLKSRSCTHHPHMHYSYTGVGAKICFPSRSTQKFSTPTLGANTKTMIDRFFIHQINVLKLLLLSL
jgi:hypothetical protein